MRRLFKIAPLLAVLAVPLPAGAQRRAGWRSFSSPRIAGGFGARRSPGGSFPTGWGRPSPFVPSSGRAIRPRFSPGAFPRPSFGGRSFGGRPFGGRPFGGRAFRPRGPITLHSYPFGYPYYSYVPSFSEYPLFGGDESYGSEGYYQPPAEAAAPQDEERDELAEQVERLSDEVAQLRQQRAYGGYTRPSATRAEAAPTVFVYRDGRQIQTRDYAILGNTLWVLGNETTRKIPLSELDLAKSKQVNDARGVDFNPPGSGQQSNP
jgi:hypothetical protein